MKPGFRLRMTLLLALLSISCVLPNTSQTGNSGDNQVNINLYLNGEFIGKLSEILNNHPPGQNKKNPPEDDSDNNDSEDDNDSPNTNNKPDIPPGQSKKETDYPPEICENLNLTIPGQPARANGLFKGHCKNDNKSNNGKKVGHQKDCEENASSGHSNGKGNGHQDCNDEND